MGYMGSWVLEDCMDLLVVKDCMDYKDLLVVMDCMDYKDQSVVEDCMDYKDWLVVKDYMWYLVIVGCKDSQVRQVLEDLKDQLAVINQDYQDTTDLDPLVIDCFSQYQKAIDCQDIRDFMAISLLVSKDCKAIEKQVDRDCKNCQQDLVTKNMDIKADHKC